MRVLVACEYSGVVRDAFARRGHFAMSCDLLPSESSNLLHWQGDVFDILGCGWDLVIMHPPCTHLAVSGARHFAAKRADGRQQEALEFVGRLMRCNAPMWALENPVSVISSHFRKPDQVIQPWQFGHDASKATCLWLHGLPPLQPTNVVSGQYGCKCGYRFDISLGKYGCPNCCGDSGAAKNVYSNQTPSGQNRLGPTVDRWKERSRTYLGIAEAMADQWGALPVKQERTP